MATKALDNPSGYEGYLNYYLPSSSVGSLLLSKSPKNVRNNVLNTIAKNDLRLDLGNTKITTEERSGILASYSDSKNTINIDVSESFFDDKNFLANALVKENVYRSDKVLGETLGIAGRELNGYLVAVKHNTFKHTPNDYKSKFLTGAGTFIWEFRNQALIVAPKYRRGYQAQFEFYIKQFAKQGVKFNFSRLEKQLSILQKFYGKQYQDFDVEY